MSKSPLRCGRTKAKLEVYKLKSMRNVDFPLTKKGKPRTTKSLVKSLNDAYSEFGLKKRFIAINRSEKQIAAARNLVNNYGFKKKPKIVKEEKAPSKLRRGRAKKNKEGESPKHNRSQPKIWKELKPLF